MTSDDRDKAGLAAKFWFRVGIEAQKLIAERTPAGSTDAEVAQITDVVFDATWAEYLEQYTQSKNPNRGKA